MVSLNESNDAIVDDMENARLVQHFQNPLMFRARLEPKQGHGALVKFDNQLHHRLLRPFRGEEEHHHLWLNAVFNGGPNRPSKNGASGVIRVDGYQPPSFVLEVMNGLVCWPFGLESSAKNVNR